jgi:16S rRNA (adenine1518-N6/adenine1519-N6)-dimethyltransferase
VTLSAAQVRGLLESGGLRPRRALGQNFVVDANTVRRIAKLAGVGPGDRVLEVGTGLGSLTLALADTGAQVTTIEVDSRLADLAREVLAQAPSVRLVNADAMHLDWQVLLGAQPGWVMVSNLPYNIATPLVATILDAAPAVSRMIVMVQREVGERLAARPGNRDYGAITVKVSYWAEASVVGSVPASVFVPRPRVDSVLVKIRRRPAPAIDPAEVRAERLFELVRAGFAHRRKTLGRAMAALVAPEAFTLAGVSPSARAEQLRVEDWGRLAAAATPAAVAERQR